MCSSAFVRVLEIFAETVQYDLFDCHEAPLPLPVETAVSNSWRLFESLSDEERTKVRARLGRHWPVKLLAYAMRMAILAVRNNDNASLCVGAMALVVDDNRLDDRDVLRVLSVLHDAGIRIGAAPDAIIARVGRFATRERSSLFRSFLDGPRYMKSIHSMGFEAEGAADTFVYRVS